MNYDAITIGSGVVDTYLFLDEKDAPVIKNPNNDPSREKLIALEFGAKIDVVDTKTTLGGGALNTSVTFSRLGLKAACVVTLGDDDNADAIEKMLAKEKVATGFIERHQTQVTGFSTLLVAGKVARDRVVLVERGASDTLNFRPEIRNITNTKWYYTTALSGDSWKKELADIARTASQHRIKWAWNPGSTQLSAGLNALKKYMLNCTVFMVNRDEAMELVNSSEHNIKALLKALRKAGPEQVVISDGINGIYYANKSNMLYMPADKSIKASEPTGAGDSFGSGFISGLIMKPGDVEFALDLGISNSESVILKIGPQEGILREADIAQKSGKGNHKLLTSF